MNRNRQAPANGEKSAQDERRISLAVWCLLSFSLIVTADHPWVMSRVALLPAGRLPLLAPARIWSPPVSELQSLSSYSHWPWILVAFLGAVCVAVSCRSVSRSDSPGTALLAVVALSLGFREMHLIPAMLMIGIRHFQQEFERAKHVRRSQIVLLALLLTGILICLEFGLLFLFWFTLLIPGAVGPEKHPNRRLKLGVFGAVLVMLFVASLHSGFRATLLRPVNWIGLHPSEGLIDSLGPVSFQGEHRWRDLVFVLLFGAYWYHSGRTIESLKCAVLPLFLFSLLGLLCTHYLWLSGIALALRPLHLALAKPQTRFHTLSMVAIFLFCILRIDAPVRFLRETFTADSFVPRQLDLAEWSTQGRVVLTNLDRSSDWQSPRLNEKFQLVMNDRWEIFRDAYLEYAAVCRDLRELRDTVYLRDDDRFGGYLQQVQAWDATLLVVDSDDLEAIRNLSLSPHWGLMGIDSRSTIFGRSNDSDNRHQLELMRRTCLALEWPDTSSQSLPPNVIAAGDSSKLPQVAAVLNAIRLPYAALRLLPESPATNHNKVKAWSYLELAHRCYRNTGEHSLLDQSRAIDLIRKLETHRHWSHDETDRLIDALGSLEIDDLSQEIFPQQSSATDKGAGVERLDPSTIRTGSRPESQFADPERHLREQILRGRKAEARQSLSEVFEHARAFYSLLIDSGERPPAELARSLHELNQQPDFPARLLPESLFYIGCLAIEVGDRSVAIQALSESEQRNPKSALSPLRVMYLQQLQRR